MSPPAILIVPSIAKGNGSGHLVRSISLARRLGANSAVYLPAAKISGTWSAAELCLAYARELMDVRIISDLAEEKFWDLVLLDRKAVSGEELAFWERFGVVIALDEGGTARGGTHFLIDVLPRVGRFSMRSWLGISPPKPLSTEFEAPNVASLGFLDLPLHRRDPPLSFRRVLVSFGGEDPMGLALNLSRVLLERGLVEARDLTLVNGALRHGGAPEGLENVSIVGPIQDLKEHLHKFDLVFTQFGLTAFEAAWAGTGVILLNPSAYHRELSRAAGFPEIGIGEPDVRALEAYLSQPADTVARTAAVAPEEREDLADLLAALVPSGPRKCPSCGSASRVAIWRSSERSYFRCSECGLIYLLRFGSSRMAPYEESYFFDEYKKQYGRTYLEDWPSLVSFAESRLDPLEELAASSLGHRKGLSILDVGCAYGPFLAAARAHGQEVIGIDIAEDAARYVRFELDIPAVSGDFADPAVACSLGGPFDAITMWYVIEHFADLDKALSNAAALLRTGGVFAFSTPSGEGISARSDPNSFYARSPEDHFTIWEPSRVGAILKAYGFRVERLRISGRHPERFPFVKKAQAHGAFRGRIALAIAGLVMRLFNLGDTFEVYTIREGEAGNDASAKKHTAAEARTPGNAESRA